jgi:hypothetical protein
MKFMKIVLHQNKFYSRSSQPQIAGSLAVERLTKIAALHEKTSKKVTLTAKELGRNWFTRFLDNVFRTSRTYLPPLHWLGVVLSATVLFLYARIVAITSRLTTTGEYDWEKLPSPCVLTVWHGEAPSLIAALAKKSPPAPIAIMISLDPRGDCLALLCRMIGLRVVRGHRDEGGWEALARLAGEIENGACVIITADGGGPARVAKIGAVALAWTMCVPLVAVGAACRPALSEKHKWDAARNPVPFGRIGIAFGESRIVSELNNEMVLEEERSWLQNALDKVAVTAKQSVDKDD